MGHVLDVVMAAPAWLRFALSGCVVIAVVLVIYAFNIYDSTRSQLRGEGIASSAGAGVVKQNEQLVRVMASLDSFSAHVDAIRGRFAERDTFARDAVGTRVRWTGEVVQVSPFGQAGKMSLVIQALSKPAYGAGGIFIFSEGYKHRLYGLRQGDVVTVSGKVDSVTNTTAFVNGDSLEVHPREEAATK